MQQHPHAEAETPESRTTPPPLGLHPMLSTQLMSSDDTAAASGQTVMSTSTLLQRRDSGRRLSVSGSGLPPGLIAPSPRRPPPGPKQASLRSLAASRCSPTPEAAATPAWATTSQSESGLQSDLRRIVERSQSGSSPHPLAAYPHSLDESPMQASIRSNRSPSHLADSDDSSASLRPTAVCRAAADAFRRDRSSRHKHGLVNFQREAMQRHSPAHSDGTPPNSASVSPTSAAAAAVGGARDHQFGVAGNAAPHTVLLEGLLPPEAAAAMSASGEHATYSPKTPALMNATVAGSATQHSADGAFATYLGNDE
jgi:hypothetical protein